MTLVLVVTVIAVVTITFYRHIDWRPRFSAASPAVKVVKKQRPVGPWSDPMAEKLRHDGDRQYLWAKGPKDPDAESSEWFDLTGSPLPLEGFRFGIGKDTIASIDHPVFVKPDDPRLQTRWMGFDLDNMTVLGFSYNGVSRAYPIPLLNRHELVNDTVGGKPVTIGW